MISSTQVLEPAELSIDLDTTDCCVCTNRPLDLKEMLNALYASIRCEPKFTYQILPHMRLNEFRIYAICVNVDSLYDLYKSLPDSIRTGCSGEFLREVDAILPKIIDAKKVDATDRFMDMLCSEVFKHRTDFQHNLCNINAIGLSYTGIGPIEHSSWKLYISIIDTAIFGAYIDAWKPLCGYTEYLPNEIINITRSVIRKQKAKRVCCKMCMYVYYAVLALTTAAATVGLAYRR